MDNRPPDPFAEGTAPAPQGALPGLPGGDPFAEGMPRIPSSPPIRKPRGQQQSSGPMAALQQLLANPEVRSKIEQNPALLPEILKQLGITAPQPQTRGALPPTQTPGIYYNPAPGRGSF